MIIAAGALSGAMISRKCTDRLRFFDELLLFLTAFRQRLSYTMSDLTCLLTSDSELLSPFLNSLSQNIPVGGSAVAAKQAMKLLPSALKLSDKKLVYEFFAPLGSNDCEGELAHCDLYISLVKQLLSSQREDAEKKAKLYRLLGTFMGIGAGLFFL